MYFLHGRKGDTACYPGDCNNGVETSLFLVLSDVDRVLGSIFEREQRQYTIEQLERYLKCRGSKLTRKGDDLFKRVRGHGITSSKQ